MKSYKFLPLIAGLSIAASVEIRQDLPTTSLEAYFRNGSDGSGDIDATLIGKSNIKIVRKDDTPFSGAVPVVNVEKRSKPDGRRNAISATEAAMKPASDKSKKGFFYRGDSRPPVEIFAQGFQPQGSDMDLHRHMSFVGGSGYVSVSRSRTVSRRYAFGRTGDKKETGYIYRVVPQNLPEGYWLPGIFSKDGPVRKNEEFAVAGSIPPENIHGAWEVSTTSPDSKGKWFENPNFAFKKSVCSILKRELCIPMLESDKELSNGAKSAYRRGSGAQ